MHFLTTPGAASRAAVAALASLTAAHSAFGGLVAYWNLNEGSGITANDISTNHNVGTLTAVVGGGVPTWVAGHTGLAGDYALNTSVQGDVTVPDSTSLHITNAFTLAAWVLDNGSNYGHVFCAGATSTTRAWLLQTSHSGGDSDYFWSDTGSTGFKKSLGYVTPLAAWHHLALTYDGSNLRIYNDGVLKNTVAQSGSLAAWGELHLGAAANNSGANGSAVNGAIDDLIIFNSVENIPSIMNGSHPAMVNLVWSGAATPNGNGQLLWSNPANWGGATMAAGKTPIFATAAAAGATTNFNDFPSNSQFVGITYNTGTAAFTLNGNTINLTGDVVNNSANAQTISNNLVIDGASRTFNPATGNLLITGAISQPAGQTNGMVKSGSNTLVLTGASTYTGATNVNTGTLLLSGASLGNTPTSVTGSSAQLAGTGSMAGPVTVATSAHLAPGINATTIGTLALGGGLTLNAANMDIKAGAPGTSDVVNVTGNLTLTGNTKINLTQQLSGFGLGDFVILTYTGTLAGSASQILPPAQDAYFSYSIQAAGNQIKLHVAPASAKTYYVSQSTGSDSNSGLTSAVPWKTLAKASTAVLNAGDAILLKCGDTWSEELQPKGSGTAGNPIYIGAYGAGNKPLIDRGDLAQQNGIHLIDQEGYKIVGIEFSHCETGIFGEFHTGNPTRKFVWIEDCYFHDSLHYGDYHSYYTAKNISVGICFWTFESWSTNVSLQDITVKNCVFRRLASGIWTNSPDNFDYNADNFYNFSNLSVTGCLFEEGYQWQLGLRGIAGGQISNCVTHDIGRLNNFVAFNGVAGAMMYRLKDFTFTESEWGFVSRGGGSGDGEAFDLEGNNTNLTFTNCLFHDADGPCIMLYQGAAHGNVGNQFNNCVWNGKTPNSSLGREEIFNANAGANDAQFTNYRIYLSAGDSRCNNETSMTFTNGLTSSLSNAASGTNLALAATNSASSQQTGFEAAKVNDGNTSTIWRPASSSNEWLELDFANPTPVNELRFREDPTSSIIRYTVQFWDDASAGWLGCFNGRTIGSNFIAPIVTRTTRKLRLLITSTTSGPPGIAEFEAYYVAIPPPPTTASWRVGDGLWDINTTANWKDSGGNPVTYVEGDFVVMDDTASGNSPLTLTLNNSVAPTSVSINATKTYFLAGSGGIGGAAGIIKNNSGTLTLSGSNTYSGGTTINGGTLSFGSAANLPAGSVALGGGTLEFSGGGAAGTYNLSASGNSGYLVNTSNAAAVLTVTRTHGNYNGMIKGGAGTIVLANNYQDSGGLEVDAGTAILNGTSSNPINWSTTNTISDVKSQAILKLGNTQVGQIFYDGGTFHMSGGVFDLNGQNPAADQNHSAPVIDGSGTITNSVAGTTGTALFKVGGNKTFSGNMVDGAGAAKLAIVLTSGSNTWSLSGTNTYSGATTINSGTLQAASVTAFSPNSAYAVASGATLALAGYSNSVGSLGGAGNVTLGTAVLTLGANNSASAVFSGVIGGTGGALIKTGSGTQSLTGNITYSGDTTVAQGTLQLTSANPNSTGATFTLAATGATIDLAFSGSQTVNRLVIGATQMPAGTYKAVGNAAAGTAIAQITSGGTLTVLSGAAFDSYASWAFATGLTGAPGSTTDSSPGADPDHDGRSNLEEFAFDGNPLSGTQDGKVQCKVLSLPSSGGRVLTLTLPLRRGATFSGVAGLVSAPIDGIVYTIQGSATPQAGPWSLSVGEITNPTDLAVIQSGLPPLSDLNHDGISEWTYRTFRSLGNVTGAAPSAFLRAKITK